MYHIDFISCKIFNAKILTFNCYYVILYLIFFVDNKNPSENSVLLFVFYKFFYCWINIYLYTEYTYNRDHVIVYW